MAARAAGAAFAAVKGPLTAMAEVSAAGAFVRSASIFRNSIPSAEFPAKPGRYLLYVSYACPWASRCLAVRALKGLEGVIGVVVVEPVFTPTRPEADDHRGWVFKGAAVGGAEGGDADADADPVYGARTLREVYEKAAGEGATKKFTVPLLFDAVSRRIVNNESAEIVRMLNTAFNGLPQCRNPGLDLYPEPLRAAIDSVNEDVYARLNNGVYRAGFATSQVAYEEAVADVFAALDHYEGVLSRQRFLAGDGAALTEADIRLFVTLIRFDAVYAFHFKCSRGLLCTHYPALLAHTREVYQLPGVRGSVHMRHIKEHYFRSHPSINPHGIVPRTPDVDFGAPHGRDTWDFGRGKPAVSPPAAAGGAE